MTQEKFITEEGLQKLKDELKTLKKRREEIVHNIEEAKQLGDLSENASYSEAREAQSFNEGRMAELEDLIRNASIISKQFTETVELGATIEVQSELEAKTLTIVGSEEANPEGGRVSHESPMGKAFPGYRKGDVVEVKTPKGVVRYTIVSIR